MTLVFIPKSFKYLSPVTVPSMKLTKAFLFKTLCVVKIKILSYLEYCSILHSVDLHSVRKKCTITGNCQDRNIRPGLEPGSLGWESRKTQGIIIIICIHFTLHYIFYSLLVESLLVRSFGCGWSKQARVSDSRFSCGCGQNLLRN